MVRKKLVTTCPPMASVAYDELAATYEQKGDKDGADSAYSRALNADKENVAAYCHYARFLGKDPKQKDKAKVIASEALRLAPRDACAEDMRALGGTISSAPGGG